jgi:hypothetical protein
VRLGGLRWPGRVLPTVGFATSNLLSITVIPLRSCVLFVVRSSGAYSLCHLFVGVVQRYGS